CRAWVRFATSARSIRFQRYRTASESRTTVKPAPAPTQNVALGPSISRKTPAEAELLSAAINATAINDAAVNCIRLVKVLRSPMSSYVVGAATAEARIPSAVARDCGSDHRLPVVLSAI